MATYELSYDKRKQLEQLIIEFPPYKFKDISKKLYEKNLQLLVDWHLDIWEGQISFKHKTLSYNRQHANQDAHKLLSSVGCFSVGNLIKDIEEKSLTTLGSYGSMLSPEDEIDLVTAYKAKTVLYKIDSYLRGYRLGYTTVNVTYSELKDIEYVIGLAENGDLTDLIDKYL